MSYQPEFNITQKILVNVSKAEAAREIIDNAALVPAWERKFQQNSVYRTVHHSTAIEGNKLKQNEAELILTGKEFETSRLRDVQEIVNYREAINYINKTEFTVLTAPLIFEIHRILGKNVLDAKHLGNFRKTNVVILNSKTADVVFDPTEAVDVESEIEELVIWDAYDGFKVHPLLRAGILHFELVRIHPFVDLNGRTARLVTTWSLYRDGFDIKKFFSLEEYYDQSPKNYYDALDSAHTGDMTKWLEYFTTGVSEELLRVKEEVQSISMDSILQSRIGQVALNERQIKVLQHLRQEAVLRNSDFPAILPEFSDDTILRDLKDLLQKGIIKKKGKTKAAEYYLAR